MNILLLGGSGRCGRLVHAALIAQGIHVRAPGSAELDLTRMHDAAAWMTWLDGADALIHTAGVLREAGSDTFAAHLRAMQSLAQAIAAQRAAGSARASARCASGTATRSGRCTPGGAAGNAGGGVGHIVLLSPAGANAASAVPWFAAKGAAENGLMATTIPVTIVRAGALCCDATGSPRRFHPQALTLDWHRAAGRLPLTPMTDAAAALVRAALGAVPQRHAIIDLAALPLARAA